MIQHRCDACNKVLGSHNRTRDGVLTRQHGKARVEIRLLAYNGHESPDLCARCMEIAAYQGETLVPEEVSH